MAGPRLEYVGAGPRVGLGFTAVPAALALGPIGAPLLAVSAISKIASLLPSWKPNPLYDSFFQHPTADTAARLQPIALHDLSMFQELSKDPGPRGSGRTQGDLHWYDAEMNLARNALEQIARFFLANQPAPPVAALPETPTAGENVAPDGLLVPQTTAPPAAPYTQQPAPAAGSISPIFGYPAGGAGLDFNTSQYPVGGGSTSWPSLIGNIWGQIAPIVTRPKVVEPVEQQTDWAAAASEIPWWVYLLAGIAAYKLLENNSGRRR